MWGRDINAFKFKRRNKQKEERDRPVQDGAVLQKEALLDWVLSTIQAVGVVEEEERESPNCAVEGSCSWVVWAMYVTSRVYVSGRTAQAEISSNHRTPQQLYGLILNSMFL